MARQDRSVLAEILTPEERAIESVVARFQRVAGAVTRVARTLSGREELRVVLGVSSRASPNEVVIDPGLFQAAYGRRAPVTPEETALASALHEAVHLVSSDFDQRRPVSPGWPSDPAPAGAAPLRGGGDGDGEGEGDTEETEEMTLLEALDKTGGPPAEALFFALEDARQERRGMAAYPGVRSVLEDLYRAALPDALRKSGPLARFAMTCFMAVGGYLEPGALPPGDARTAAARRDAAGILEKAAAAGGPWETAALAVKLLAVARFHGLVSEGGEADCADRQAREQAEKEAMESGLDRVRLFSPIVSDAERYREVRRSPQQASGQTGNRGEAEEASNEGADQLLMISQAPVVYLPTGQSGKLAVSRAPESFRRFAGPGRGALLRTAAEWRVDQRHVSGELYPLFAANQRRGLQSGFDAGDFSPHAALLLGAGLYERMYERRSISTRRSYAVSVLVDGSASMLQPRRLAGPGDRRPWGLAAAMLGAWTLAALCSELRVDFELALFNRGFAARADDTEWTYTRRRTAAVSELRRVRGEAADRLTSTVNHYLLSGFGEPWRRSDDILAGLFWTAAEAADAGREARRSPRRAPPVSMFEKAANVDEFNVIYAAQRMASHGAQVRVMVVLADGMTRGSMEALVRSVEEVDGRGATVLGIGVGDNTVVSAYRRHQVVTRPDELAQSMVAGVGMALRRGLAMYGLDTWWGRAGRQTNGRGARPPAPARPSRAGKPGERPGERRIA